ncbi:uncharacterized protein LOC127714789 [Mytilus californianus]|uniref:uncharacterized protein LOC127714789 n=1 Tax=Mytilus californianus TaxID=6549 RepID=UPI00224635D7|nr:uncharacterized protein LOC127714789 [Mytilus californianus]
MYSMALVPVRAKYINLSSDYSPRLNIETVVQDMQVFYPKHVLDAAKYEYIDLLKTENLLHTKYPEQFRSLVKNDDKVYVSEAQFPTLSVSKLYQVLKTAERHRRSAWRNAMLEFISLQRIQKLYVQLEGDNKYLKKNRHNPERVKIGLIGRLSPTTPPKSPNMIVTARSQKSPLYIRKDGFVSADEYDELRLELTKRDNAIQELTSRVSALANQHIYDGFPTFKYANETVNSTNIAEKFALVFENEWKAAYEDLADRGYHDEEIVYKLMRVIRYAYPFCQQIAEDQIIELIHTMEHPNVRQKNIYALDKGSLIHGYKSPLQLPSGVATRLAKEYRRASSTLSVPSVIQYFKESTASRLELNYKTLVSMNSYIDKCVELIWYMCVQDPSMILRWPDPDDAVDPTIFKYYKKKGTVVKHAVWPALYLHDAGLMLKRGCARPY